MKNSEDVVHLQPKNPLPKENPSFTIEISFQTHFLSRYSLFLSRRAGQVGKKEQKIEFYKWKAWENPAPHNIYIG